MDPIVHILNTEDRHRSLCGIKIDRGVQRVHPTHWETHARRGALVCWDCREALT